MSKWTITLMFFMLLGCQEALYNKLSEKEANQMLVVLDENGIDADKAYEDRDGRVTLMVAAKDMARATSVLTEHGLPREKFTNLGEVFSKDSLISSPTEEHARYIYALSQDLSRTIANLDGVIFAKVHLVIPPNRKKSETNPTASVVIKHSPEVDMAAMVPQIKMMVKGSVEGLEYDAVSVSLFPSQRLGTLGQGRQEAMTTVMGIEVAQKDASKLWLGIGILTLFLFSLAGLYLKSVSGPQPGREAKDFFSSLKGFSKKPDAQDYEHEKAQ